MPGVTNIAPDTAQVQGGFLQTNIISVDGMGISGTGYYLDGMWNIAPGNMVGLTITPNPDSIQEVRVLQSDYSTQYSLYGSNAIILQTKSGTDTFHGTAYEYLRNDVLDARNFFSPSVPPLKQNIFGYNLSGPLYLPGHGSGTKKTFFFWSQQWSVQHIGLPATGGGTGGITLIGADPTAAMRNGTFNAPITDPLTGQPFPQTSPGVYQIPSNRINANALTFLNAFAPLPNNPSNGFLNYINLNPEINNTRDDEIKIDHNFSDRLRLMAEYLDDHQDNENPSNPYISSPFNVSRGAVTTFNSLTQVQLTATITPTMVNTTSVNMDSYIPSLLARGLWLQSQLPDFHQTLPFHGFLSDRLPQVNFAGGWSSIGQATVIPSPNPANLVNTLSDDWSWVRGKHFLQAGVALQYDTPARTPSAPAMGSGFSVASSRATPSRITC